MESNASQILPWDSDIDVQMTVDTMQFLASYYNLSVWHYHLPHIPEGRDYILEMNPDFAINGPNDKWNMIDGRWIDTETGLFIDITTLRPNKTARAEGVEGALMCKDRHHYLVRYAMHDRIGWRDINSNLFRRKRYFPCEKVCLKTLPSRYRSTTNGCWKKNTPKGR